jgi:hypothetical protein
VTREQGAELVAAEKADARRERRTAVARQRRRKARAVARASD